MGQHCQHPEVAQHQHQDNVNNSTTSSQEHELQNIPHVNFPEINNEIKQLREKNHQLITVSQHHYNKQTSQNFYGYLQHNQKQGYGELKTSSGKMYFGYFRDNLPHIRGILIFSNEHCYIGQFHNGKMHGKGKEISTHFIFEGEYDNDAKKHGRFLTNDLIYQGTFMDNLFSSYGQLRFKNGQKYCGHFIHNQFNGHGKYYSQNNKLIYQGQFKDNKYHGKGQYYWDDGSCYHGEYINGVKHGEGRYVKEGEEMVDGVWEMGVIVQRYNSKVDKSETGNGKNSREDHSTRTEEVY